MATASCGQRRTASTSIWVIVTWYPLHCDRHIRQPVDVIFEVPHAAASNWPRYGLLSLHLFPLQWSCPHLFRLKWASAKGIVKQCVNLNFNKLWQAPPVLWKGCAYVDTGIFFYDIYRITYTWTRKILEYSLCVCVVCVSHWFMLKPENH